jgi:hypothetical protein
LRLEGKSSSKLRLRREGELTMEALLIIVVVVLLLGGGGWYGRGRWY